MLDHSSGLGVALRCEARMQTFCISCRHLQGLLADRVCHSLPLCFAPELAATSCQLSRLVAAVSCEADANCVYDWPTLARLCTDKSCGRLPLCFAPKPSATTDQSSRLGAALRREADANCLYDCFAGTRRDCLPTEVATAFLFALHR